MQQLRNRGRRIEQGGEMVISELQTASYDATATTGKVNFRVSYKDLLARDEAVTSVDFGLAEEDIVVFKRCVQLFRLQTKFMSESRFRGNYLWW